MEKGCGKRSHESSYTKERLEAQEEELQVCPEEVENAQLGGLHLESEESSSLLQTAVSVLQNSYLDCASRDGFQYSQAILVENDVFLNELKAFAQAKEAAGYSQEELEETFAFLLFDNEDEAKEVCQTGLRINTSSISTLGDPAKGVYISKYADCLHPRPWHHGKSGYIVIFKLIKGKVKAVCENHTSSYTCPSPGYDCHIAVSRNTGTSRGSPFQAFEQSQYYVYEVSGGSVAERPRQICPYMVIACQYKEPKGMPLLARESLPDLNHKASYCPWRGQLSIQGQLLCSIALRTPFSSTMPAQLPPNLDMSHVMGLSDLKKKLPAAAFGKSNYTRNEVCFQGIYFSLYEVEISNKEQHKMDELLQNLKEKDLAIIKYLQDQGVLILLTSAALTGDDVFDPKEPISLLALFLFTSSRSVCPRADQQDPKAEREDGGISLKIASVLPGLQYAMEKATKSSHGDPVSTGVQIKRYFQEFAKLEQNAQPTSGQNSPVPLSSLLSPAEEEGTNPLTKCSEQSFSQLQRYLSDPSSYSLEISAALGCLAGAAQSLCCSSEAVCNVDSSLVVPPDPVPPLKVKNETANAAAGLTQGGKGTTADVSSASKLRVQQSKRKSSRPVVTSNRKKWSPLKMQIHPVGDGGRNRKANKKKKINFAFPKKPGLAASSSEPMLKLANLQFPHRRKRGAEVLSAEFVHKTQAEPVREAASSPAGEAKRAKTLKKPDRRKVSGAQATTEPPERKMIKSPMKPQARKQAASEPKEPISVPPSETLCKNHGASSVVSGIYPAEDVVLQGNDYESHALNLLADLALGSCIPALVPTGAVTEQRSQRRPRTSRSAFDHEYHRMDRLAKGGTSPGKSSPNHKLEKPAGKTDLKKDSALTTREKSPGISSKKSSLSPSSAKPSEAQEPAEATKPSFISSEHSYASQMPEHARKPPPPRGMPHPMASVAKNGARSGLPGPLVGKVVPWQRCGGGPAVRRPAAARPREEFAKTHTVMRRGGSVTVTCRCEAEYLFSLDSRYTRDALEKTVIRALHGPWDPDLPDDVEETKLILHMWVALFYSKPSKLLSSTRKVVEHSNPKKFVSINSTGDFLELSDDSEDCFGLETCPADSQSDPDRIPSLPEPGTRSQGPFCAEQSPADSQMDAEGTRGVVDSTVSSSVGELPCVEEPSSTSFPESPSLSVRAEGSSPMGGDEWPAQDIPGTPPEELPREEPLDTAATPGPSEELGNARGSPSAPVREKPRGGALGSSRDGQSGARCGRHGRGEPLESGCPGPPVGGVGQDPQHVCSPGPLEAGPSSTKPEQAGGEGRESQDSSGQQEREEEEAKEEKDEEEDSGCKRVLLRPGALACSEGSSEDMEREDGEMVPVNAAHPEDPTVPGDPAGLMPEPLGATTPGKTAASLCTLQEPQEAQDSPGVDLELSRGLGLPLRLSPGACVIHGAQDSGVGECHGAGWEAGAEDRAPAAEGRAPVGPDAPGSAGPARPSAPEHSPVPVAALHGAADTAAPPESGAAPAAIPSPPPSVPGGDSCHPARGGGDSDADLTSLSTEESNHQGARHLHAPRGAETSPCDAPELPGIELTGTLAVREPQDGAPGVTPPAPTRQGRGADPRGPELPPDSRAGTEWWGPAGRCSRARCVSQEQLGTQARPQHRRLHAAEAEGASGAAGVPEASTCTDPTLGSSCSDSDQEGFGGTVWELRTSRASYSMKSLDAADTGSSWDASSVGSERADGHSEGWSSPGAREGWWQPEPPYVTIPDERGVPRDYVNFTVTRRHRDVGAWQPEQRCSRHEGHSHLLRSLVGTRRTSTDITQGTLDLECLRFHYKLNQILRSRKPPSSTSESIFPRDSPGLVPPGLCPGRAALAPRSRSPLQVTLLRSATGPDGATWHCAAPGHLRKLRYDGQPQDTRGDIAGILDEYAEFGRVMLGRVGTGLARGATAPPCTPRPHRHQPSAFGDMITNLCSSLRFRLRRVARDARAGLFYVVETGEDLFFARAKALLEKDGHKETEPLRFCRATRLASERLLVVIRNEDISSHIHKVPCLLRLKHCPDVVFAGVDQPEDLPGRTYQELFHMGGFVVSGDEVLETVTLGQLKEVVKVLEKLNGSGRWKWLLHYKESKKLREDLRVDANARKKNLILKSCQGADLVEVLHYHACDSGASPKAEYLKCLLNLQVQRVSARFAVYLTEKPALSKEVLESQGILVADVNTFLGTMQQVAAPFRRSYW